MNANYSDNTMMNLQTAFKDLGRDKQDGRLKSLNGAPISLVHFSLVPQLISYRSKMEVLSEQRISPLEQRPNAKIPCIEQKVQAFHVSNGGSR